MGVTQKTREGELCVYIYNLWQRCTYWCYVGITGRMCQLATSKWHVSSSENTVSSVW